MNMQTTNKRDEPVKRPQPAPGRGSPSTHAAQSLRKTVTVRVAVPDPRADSDELKEHGYGHGV
jgi:hypothetical protein